MSLEIGSIVEGVITGITKFGAFVRLPKGNTGLVHISEIANTYVKDVHEFVSERDNVKVKILGVNEKGKYDLSLRQAQDEELQIKVQTEPQPEMKEPPIQERIKEEKPKVHEKYKIYDKHERRRDSGKKRFSFEDKLSRFMKESEERLLDLKRNTEAKRGRKR